MIKHENKLLVIFNVCINFCCFLGLVQNQAAALFKTANTAYHSGAFKFMPSGVQVDFFSTFIKILTIKTKQITITNEDQMKYFSFSSMW